MKDSIGGMWLLGIVMTFMVLLITFVTISLNYSDAFRMKSEMITAIEESNGFNLKTKAKIDGIIDKYGYKSFKTCQFKEPPSNVLGFLKDGRNEGKPYVNNYDVKVNYCVVRNIVRTSKKRVENYYTVQVFFGFQLPVMGDIFTFRVDGETRSILYADDSGYDHYFSS